MLVNRRKKKEARRSAVKRRVRRKVRGSGERPRLSVFRSARQMYLQLIDDDSGVTLAAVSTLEKAFRDLGFEAGGNIPAATAAGKLLAERAGSAGVVAVVFDRNGYDYHGRVRAAAEAAREGGLKF